MPVVMDMDIPDYYYEFIYLTVHYPCRHAMLRAVRREDATAHQLTSKGRIVYSARERCPNCQAIVDSRDAAKRWR